MLALTALVLLAVSLALTLCVLPALERQARRQGLMDRPGGRKQHGSDTPLVGGIAVLVAVAVPALSGLAVALVRDSFGLPLPDAITEHLPGMRTKAPELIAILAGAAAMLVLGHWDDRKGLSAGFRLLMQVLCALALALMGIRITVFIAEPWLHVALTVGFIVFVTNAVNFLDNMNGLMAGAVAIAALHLLVLAIATGQWFMAALLICLLGGLLGFLSRNFPTARVFIGDAGSLAIGFLLAAMTVLFTFTETGNVERPFIMPLLVLALPLADGATVVVSRLRRGVHPFTAGRDHLSHRLVARGCTPTRAVLILWGAAFVCGIPSWFMAPVTPPVLAIVWGGAGAIAALLMRTNLRLGEHA